MYVHYITRLCEYFLAFYVTGYVHTWDIGMWLVLVRNGLSCPMLIVDWLCHTLLLGELFTDVFTFFPRVLFGLAVLVWALGLGFPMPHMHTHCYKLNYHIHSWISGTHIHIFNHIYPITGKDQTDLLFPTPSVDNNNILIFDIKCRKKFQNSLQCKLRRKIWSNFFRNFLYFSCSYIISTGYASLIKEIKNHCFLIENQLEFMTGDVDGAERKIRLTRNLP